MPVPKPEKGEDKNEFMGRCMSFLKKEGKFKQDQKVAICLSTWRRANEEATVSTDVEKNLAKGHVDVIGGTTRKKKKKKKKKDELNIVEKINNYINERV